MVWQGNSMGAAWARHAMCESAFKVMKTSGVQLLDQFSDNQLKRKLKPRHYSPGVYTE
jgi:hypothetical protein